MDFIEFKVMEPQQHFLAIKRQCDLQREIRKRIKGDNGADCEFFYENENKLTYLTVVTINPKHQEMFTLHQTHGYKDSIGCLDEVMAYLDNIHRSDSGIIPYKVSWCKLNENNRNESTFYVKNLQELTDKFYENKNVDDYVIQSVVMLPMS